MSSKVPLPQEAREYLDQNLKSREFDPSEPFFINKAGNRLNCRNVYRLCQRVVEQALLFLLDDENLNLLLIN